MAWTKIVTTALMSNYNEIATAVQRGQRVKGNAVREHNLVAPGNGKRASVR